MQDSVGLDLKLTSYLFYLLVILSSNSGKKALEKPLSFKTSSGTSSTSGGRVFLIPPSINDEVHFPKPSEDAPPVLIVLAGKLVPFLHQSEDLSNIWTSDPVNLVASTLYDVELSGYGAESLSWRIVTSSQPQYLQLPFCQRWSPTRSDVGSKCCPGHSW
jgi:hypothetical protein